MPNDNMIAALKRERAVYEGQGKTDRVRQVDEQLEHYQAGGDEAPAVEEPADRSGPDSTQRTADSSGGAAKKTAARKTAASKPPAETEQPVSPPAE